MLRRGSKTSYNPYATSRRVKKSDAKAKDQLDILPNKPIVWLKQVGVFFFLNTLTHAHTHTLLALFSILPALLDHSSTL